MSVVSFKNIYHGLSQEPGEMRIVGTGLAWQGSESKSVVTIAADTMKWLQWIRVARNFQLRIGLKGDRQRETFDGFLRDDHDKISNLIRQHYDLPLETKEISLRGWNWGETDVQNGDLAFVVSNKTSFEIPLNHIANSNIAGRTEVSLEFINPDQQQPDTKPSATAASTLPKKKPQRTDELVEMRFYVPGVVTRDADGDEKMKGEEGEEEEEEEEEVSAAQAFHDMIKEKAEIGQAVGEGIVEFSEVLMLTPRGRYDIDMFPTFMRLRGKTYDYKILHTSVTRLFLLPKPDEIHIQLVIGLDPPIHQGQTRYPFLVMQFTREDNLEASLKLDDETIATKYDGKLQKTYDAPAFQVVSNVFRALTGRKLIAPGSFNSHNGQSGIRANMKAVQGDLYFLDKSLLFIAKQPTLVDYTDIHQVVFSRLGGVMASAKTFDLKIVQKNAADISFTSINKEEHPGLEEFLKGKKVRVKNEMNDGDLGVDAVGLSSDEDEEMQSVQSDEDAPVARKAGGDEDEDSEEDEDFHVSDSDGGSPSSGSGSDDAASDDDAMSIGSGDRELVKSATKKSAPAKAKPKKAAKKSDDDDEDGEADEAPKKKKKPVQENGKEKEKEKKAPPKPKKVKKAKEDGDDEEDGEGDKEKPKPKPRPKPKKVTNGDAEEEGPKKKKQKTAKE